MTSHAKHRASRRRKQFSFVMTSIKLVLVGAVLLSLIGLTGCQSSTDGDAPSISAAPAFNSAPTVSGRLNPSNDGTSFEPCTGVSPQELRTAGVDPATWTDISVSNHGPRGCRATSSSKTVTVIVFDTSARDLYPGNVAVQVSSTGQFALYRFIHGSACAAVTYAGESLISVSVAEQRHPGTDLVPDEIDCGPAAGLLAEAMGPTADGPRTDPSGARRAPPSDTAYTRLIQVGILRVRTVNGIDAPLVDASGRLRPYRELAEVDPQDPGVGSAASLALNSQLEIG